MIDRIDEMTVRAYASLGGYPVDQSSIQGFVLNVDGERRYVDLNGNDTQVEVAPYGRPGSEYEGQVEFTIRNARLLDERYGKETPLDVDHLDGAVIEEIDVAAKYEGPQIPHFEVVDVNITLDANDESGHHRDRQLDITASPDVVINGNNCGNDVHVRNHRPTLDEIIQDAKEMAEAEREAATRSGPTKEPGRD